MFAEGDKVYHVVSGQRGRVVSVKGRLVRVYVFRLTAVKVFSEKELTHAD